MSAERDLADEFPEIEPRDGRRLRGTPIAAGQRFGRLVAIRPAPPRAGSTSLHWQFRCDCGNFCVQKVARVAAGRYVSCGCKHRETLETFTAKAKARSVAAAAQGRGRLTAERDLAEVIHHEIISPESVEYALEVWRDTLLLKTWSEYDRMKSMLSHVSGGAIDTVLARRQREAARTGPWDGGHHFQEEDGYPGSLVPKKRSEP